MRRSAREPSSSARRTPCDGDGAEVHADPPRANADAVRVNAHLVEGDGAVLVIVLRGESG